jgi:hypothetical protein
MANISLTKGYSTRVDDSDVLLVAGFEWYAMAMQCGIFAARISDDVLMHRFLLGISDPKVQVDHRDRNGLNNSRSNLRTRPIKDCRLTCPKEKPNLIPIEAL